MAFIKLPVDVFDTFTVIARPIRTFSSSSLNGVDGAVKVFKRLSDIEQMLIHNTRLGQMSVS